ncbi:MAG: putative histidine kinase, atypical unorthodox [Ramlibacter sp.]|nr:putative histidine kinase, atypical unorthodox [Ramlibacter sp.]
MKAIQRLFSHYADYHRHGPLLLRYLSLLGFVFFPCYYLLRFTKADPVYDDWAIRAVDAVICILLFLRDRWPASLKRYYFAYSYAVLIVTLPLTFVFTSLKNGGGTVAVGNTLMAVFLVLLLTDWRNMIVILTVGFGLGTALYMGTEPNPTLPADYVGRVPILLATVVGGSLFKFALERATAERVRNAYAALAGSIAHEMRNPLAQIKHSLEGIENLLPQQRRGQSQTLGGEELTTLHRHVAEGELAVKRGLQVIAMTLDEVNARPPDRAKLALLSAAEVSTKAVQDYSYENEDQRARVVVQVLRDFTFRGDETAYMFVLFNLIKNSLYYIGPFPDTQLAIIVENQQIRVRDNGPGIAPDALEGLFEPFRSAGKAGGTGLGLVYCRRVMQAFGGEISCASVQGEYTEFTMRFPPVDETEREEHRRAAIAQARTVLAGKRLLIVEDDPVQRMATRQKLGLLALTAELEEAPDGQTALKMMERRPYDIVLLDLRMPGVDGYAVADKIRREPGINQDVRILAYTSEPPHLARERALRSGMDGYVSKPCAQLPLLAALQALVQQPRGVPSGIVGRLAGRRILLADDSAFNRKAVAAYLTNAAATVIEAEHGKGVIDQLHALEGFDAVVLDLHMPGMDGLETARVIRGGGASWSNVPIIALTARSDEAAVAAARAAGMNGFLVKPVDQGLLYEALVKAVSGRPVGAVASPGATPAPVPDDGLLNFSRLESYRRLGMLGELVNDYLPEMARLLGKLHDAVGRDDRETSLSALHSLLGMSGEAGAQALYQQVRRVYVPLLEQENWPPAGWLDQLQVLAQRTDAALKAYCAAEARTSNGD